ncbi:MAG: nucleotide exchange factor GrpE [Bacilli bacterium]|nr:nucleotide exchange factor GrpE [Bacilli bacterium]
MEDNKKDEVVEEVTEETTEQPKEEPVKKKTKKAKIDVTKEPEYLALVEENAKLMDQLLRKQAEFENYKKRVAEERQRDRKYALQDFLMESIETLDILDKAVNFKTDDQVLKNFLSGFIMVNNRLKNILQNYGVVQIDCLNKPFDPTYHSALETVETEGVESNIVVEVVMTGYMYKDRVLRPSMVKVSK